MEVVCEVARSHPSRYPGEQWGDHGNPCFLGPDAAARTSATCSLPSQLLSYLPAAAVVARRCTFAPITHTSSARWRKAKRKKVAQSSVNIHSCLHIEIGGLLEKVKKKVFEFLLVSPFSPDFLASSPTFDFALSSSRISARGKSLIIR